jgi:hypothetical protein
MIQWLWEKDGERREGAKDVRGERGWGECEGERYGE